MCNCAGRAGDVTLASGGELEAEQPNEELMTRYDGKTFEGQHLVLDDGIFINCIFKNCSLEYGGGDVYVQNCQGDGCQLIWRGPAQRTVFLLQGLGLMAPPPVPPGGTAPGRVQ